MMIRKLVFCLALILPLSLNAAKDNSPQGKEMRVAAAVDDVEADGEGVVLRLSFPPGETHYLIIQGLASVSGMRMKGVDWQAAADYGRFASGWYFDGETNALYVKLTHDNQLESVSIRF